MNLTFISDKSCPVCGDTTVVKEEIETGKLTGEKVRIHCNGGLWEKRTFSCGQTLSYVPNFGKTELSKYSVCTNSVEYENKILKRIEAKSAIMEFINILDVDDDYKNRVKNGHFYVD